jgi:cell division protease FtsH
MVTMYGMNEKVGNVSFNDPQQEYGFIKPYSDKTAEMIDEEVRKLINTCYTRTKDLLIDKRQELEVIAQELLKKEIIFQNDLEMLIGKRPFDHKTSYQEYMDKEIQVSENVEATAAGTEDKTA